MNARLRCRIASVTLEADLLVVIRQSWMLVRTLVAKRTVPLQVIFAIRDYAIDFNVMFFSEEITEGKVVGRCF